MVRLAAAVTTPPPRSWQQNTQRFNSARSACGTMATSRTLALAVRCSRKALISSVWEPATRVKTWERTRTPHRSAAPCRLCGGAEHRERDDVICCNAHRQTWVGLDTSEINEQTKIFLADRHDIPFRAARPAYRRYRGQVNVRHLINHYNHYSEHGTSCTPRGTTDPHTPRYHASDKCMKRPLALFAQPLQEYAFSITRWSTEGLGHNAVVKLTGWEYILLYWITVIAWFPGC